MKTQCGLLGVTLALTGACGGRSATEAIDDCAEGDCSASDGGSRSGASAGPRETPHAAGGTRNSAGSTAAGGTTGILVGSGGNVEPPPNPCGDPIEPVPVEVPTGEKRVISETVVVKPTAMFLMLDRSASMIREPDNWGMATAGISEFVSDTASQGLQMALQYFPLDTMDYGVVETGPAGPVSSGPDCRNVAAHAPQVPFRMLPDLLDEIRTSLESTTPQENAASSSGGATAPIEIALRALTASCAEFQADNEKWQCLGVLATGSVPVGCSTDVDALSQILESAWNDNHVRTFVIGMQGADFALLDRLATAGHGDCNPTTTDTYEACGNAAVADNLRTIAENRFTIETAIHPVAIFKVDPCKFLVPSEDERFDKNLLNVTLRHSGSEVVIPIPHVHRPADCTEYGDTAWYYDQPDAPTQVELCEGACRLVKETADTRVEFLLGCHLPPEF